MTENKRITLDWDTTGLTVYCIIRREADDFRMDNADGSFAEVPAAPYISLTEDAVIKGRYELDEARTVWTDGRYSVAIYSQAGGSEVPANDTIIGTGEMYINSDLEVVVDASINNLNDLSIGDITGEVQNGVFARVAVTGDAIQIIEGNFKTISIDLGSEWDTTGKFVYFVMKRQNSSDAPIVNRVVDRIISDVDGTSEIDLLDTETTPKGCYGYQIELRNDPADDEPETAMKGTAEITENLRS